MHNLSESATTDNKQSERMRAMLAAKQYINKEKLLVSVRQNNTNVIITGKERDS
jgi:hypothetical protein